MKKTNKTIIQSAMILLALGYVLYAEPYMAVRTGLKCITCHINVTGGGKRSDFGVEYSHFKLKIADIRPAGKPVFFGGQINEILSVGGNVRFDNETNFRYTPPVSQAYVDYLAKRDIPYTDSIKRHYQDSLSTQATNNTLMTEGDLYFQIDVLQNLMTYYVDHDLKGNGAPREIWGMMRVPFWNGYLKGGKMLLPYGLRILDDNAFIRKPGTNYSYDRRGLGGEIGIEPGPFSLIANLTDAEFQTIGTIVYRRWRVGASFGRYTRNKGGFFFTQGHRGIKLTGNWKLNFWGEDYTWGVFAGGNFGRFTLLSEVDIITKYDALYKKNTDRVAFYLENNFHIIRGLNLKSTYEFFDRNSKLLGNPYGVELARLGQDRITLGFDLFITPFAQIGAFYRVNRWVPDNTSVNKNQLILRIHGFF